MKRRSDAQLDLFQPDIQTAKLLCFPASRMVGSAREAAAEILARPDSKRASRYRTLVNLIHIRLLLLGFPREVIDAETDKYRDAIDAQMRRQILARAMNARDGGAA